MAAGPPSSVRAERVLRAACAAMAAAGALLLGFSAQTKTVLFIQKKAVPKDVQALWVLIVAAAAAAAYHVAQLARCFCMERLAITGGGGGCRRLGRAVACASFLLDKGCAYMVFATTVAALQACFVGLLGVDALQWSKLCNIYTRFCEQAAAGMVCSLLAAVGMAVLSAFSARDLFRRPCSPEYR
ncbi:CASP-like protein 2C4 [Zea mays]|uniref:CASP-like protein n=1 Tax=Zea mays TaxID=4577 RepID=A0A3L6EL34_MAIZE|nr:CASP-like protein 2C4 [Zea mays]